MNLNRREALKLSGAALLGFFLTACDPNQEIQDALYPAGAKLRAVRSGERLPLALKDRVDWIKDITWNAYKNHFSAELQSKLRQPDIDIMTGNQFAQLATPEIARLGWRDDVDHKRKLLKAEQIGIYYSTIRKKILINTDSSEWKDKDEEGFEGNRAGLNHYLAHRLLQCYTWAQSDYTELAQPSQVFEDPPLVRIASNGLADTLRREDGNKHTFFRSGFEDGLAIMIAGEIETSNKLYPGVIENTDRILANFVAKIANKLQLPSEELLNLSMDNSQEGFANFINIVGGKNPQLLSPQERHKWAEDLFTLVDYYHTGALTSAEIKPDLDAMLNFDTPYRPFEKHHSLAYKSYYPQPQEINTQEIIFTA